MYLSSFQFNHRRKQARRLLDSPHALHAAVMSSFPDPSPTENGRVLWRIDKLSQAIKLIVVSPNQPDFTHLSEQAGWPTIEDSWASNPYQPLLDRIENGHHYAFRLTANPTHSSMEERKGNRGKVYGHHTIQQQQNWLLTRQERCGFEIPLSLTSLIEDKERKAVEVRDFLVRDRKPLSFKRREAHVTLHVVSYEGSLTVTDREAFVHTLMHGIGRAKGYGCGLLTIAALK